MIPDGIYIRELMAASVDKVFETLITLSYTDQVGTMTELLITDAKNEGWAQQDSIKKQLYRQVAHNIHKFDYRFLIEAFRECDMVFAQNGKPSLYAWTNVRWRDECERFQREHAAAMNKEPILTEDQLEELEVMAGGRN